MNIFSLILINLIKFYFELIFFLLFLVQSDLCKIVNILV